MPRVSASSIGVLARLERFTHPWESGRLDSALQQLCSLLGCHNGLLFSQKTARFTYLYSSTASLPSSSSYSTVPLIVRTGFERHLYFRVQTGLEYITTAFWDTLSVVCSKSKATGLYLNAMSTLSLSVSEKRSVGKARIYCSSRP